MKNLFKITTAVLFSMLFVACSSSSNDADLAKIDEMLEDLKQEEKEPETEVVEVEDIYSMEIPKFMTSTKALNQDASLQYNSLYKEKYIIVIHEDKNEFADALKMLGEYDESEELVDNYAKLQLEYMGQAGTITAESDMKSEKINGLDARLKAVDAEVTGVPEAISYWLGYVEGEEMLYTIMAWTLESRKSDFEDEAHAMIRSLKELE